MRGPRSSRPQQILEALARELEVHPGDRITTARLAEVVGVSEAALYRHFPSKAKMFEGLIEFAEQSVFGLVGRILDREPDPLRRCEQIATTALTFAARNPGITRILLGDALVGENQRLRARVAQFFSRLETQLKQILREGRASAQSGGEEERDRGRSTPIPAFANLLMAVIEGRMTQFVRSGFQQSPLDGWPEQWNVLRRGSPAWLARPGT